MPECLHSFTVLYIKKNTDALIYSYIVIIAGSVLFKRASSKFSAVFNFLIDTDKLISFK